MEPTDKFNQRPSVCESASVDSSASSNSGSSMRMGGGLMVSGELVKSELEGEALRAGLVKVSSRTTQAPIQAMDW